MEEFNSGLISTGFTVLCYVVWKIVKRYSLKSTCNHNQLHITVQDLNEKISETHEFIKLVSTELVNAVKPTTVSMTESTSAKQIREEEEEHKSPQ
jgi:hypothetical protein